VKVQRGDTLIGLVKTQHRQQGLHVSENQAFRLAHQIAADNRLPNPDLIRTGQRIDFSRLNLPAVAKGPASALDLPAAAKAALQQLPSTPLATAAAENTTAATDHPLLDRVLDRAVGKGFIPGQELAAVRSKIVQLSEKYNFKPDDFARLSLMESGGMNPQASNGHCHGVIQFCDGPARGAAAVGFASNAKAILGMSLFKQLDLVDQYFSKVGMPPNRKTRAGRSLPQHFVACSAQRSPSRCPSAHRRPTGQPAACRAQPTQPNHPRIPGRRFARPDRNGPRSRNQPQGPRTHLCRSGKPL